MTISVLMSVYKKEKPYLLQRAMDSIWTKQILKPNEIVLIEDGPLSEELERVITKWKKELGNTLRIIRNEKNLGLTKSLNRGIKEIKSELVARMDSDDESLPNRFKSQHDYFINHPEVDIIGSSVDVCDENGILLYNRAYPLSHDEVRRTMPKYNPLAHPAVMMRSTCFTEKRLMYNEEYRTVQDMVLWFDALKAGCRFANLPDVLLRFTESKDMYSSRRNNRAKIEFKAFASGIRKNFGLCTFLYIYPIGRFIVRSIPPKLIKYVYSCSLYKKMYAKKLPK